MPAALDLERLAVRLEKRTDFLESQRVVRGIVSTIESLVERPYLDALLEDYPKLRRRPCLGHSIVYQVFDEEEVVEIMRILGQRQSLGKHLR